MTATLTARQPAQLRDRVFWPFASALAALLAVPGLAPGQDAEPVAIDRAAPVVVETAILIDAPPAEVWRALTDVARWPEWNELIGSATLDGPLAAGSTVAWSVGPMDIRSRLTRVEPGAALDWEGTDGDTVGLHSWRLLPEGEGTRLLNAESISGGMAAQEPEASTERLAQFLHAWNERLKAEAER